MTAATGKDRDAGAQDGAANTTKLGEEMLNELDPATKAVAEATITGLEAELQKRKKDLENGEAFRKGRKKIEDELKDKKEGFNGLLNFFSSSVLYAIMIFVVVVKLGQGLASNENVSQAVVTWVILGSALILLGKVFRDKAAGTKQGIKNAQIEEIKK